MTRQVHIKKHPQTWVPRDAVEFFRINSDIWRALDSGKTVKISEKDFDLVSRFVVKIEEDSKPIKIEKDRKTQSTEVDKVQE